MHSERSGEGGGGHGVREAILPPSWLRGTEEHGGGGGRHGKAHPWRPVFSPVPAASGRPDPAGTAGTESGTAVTRHWPPWVAAGRGREAVNGQGAAEAGGVRRRASRRGPPGELPAGCPPPPSRAALCPGAHGPAGHGGARRRARRQRRRRGTGFVPRPPRHGSASHGAARHERLGIARRGTARLRSARLGSGSSRAIQTSGSGSTSGPELGSGRSVAPCPGGAGPFTLPLFSDACSLFDDEIMLTCLELLSIPWILLAHDA